MPKKIDGNAIKGISQVLGEYITGSELTKLFSRLNFFDHDSTTSIDKFSTKWRRIENTLNTECRKVNSAKPAFILIEQVLTPISFVKSPDDWDNAKREINSTLIFYGYEFMDNGKVVVTTAAETFSEARKRLTSFEEKLSLYDIHPLVIDYCKEEFFVENYFHAIFESSKGVLEHVRRISETDSDGSTLINDVFRPNNPIILIKGNMISTQTERSEYNGLKSLLNTIVYLYRNPQAHEPKLYNDKSETDAITAFTLMSLAHRTLDNCVNIRDFSR